MTNCNHEEEHAFAAARAKMNMPKEEEIASLSTAFKAISEPSRLKILRSEEHTSEPSPG